MNGIIQPEDLDNRMVEEFQLLSPLLSSVDRAKIKEAFANGRVFASVTDNDVRRTLKRRILAYPYCIPSLHSFLEDTKFFKPAATIVKRLINRK